MDTLCIPVGRIEWALRLSQIDKMASIYKGAIANLVLDAEIMATLLDSEACNFDEDGATTVADRLRLSTESRARIACSVWMSRSWTFQEGQLPPTIAVQFLDNVVAFGRLSEYDRTYREEIMVKEAFLPNDTAAPCEASVLAERPAGDIMPDSQPSFRLSSQNEYTPPSNCDCADIDLEGTFCSTFFDETTDFVTVWNELAGRSTTMPNDVPLIITNILDFDNRQLLKHMDVAEMFQIIILSLGLVPFSVFFYNGPRHVMDSSHHNRWVPVGIGKDTLTPTDPMTVCSSHFLYEHGTEADSGRISVYMIDTILPLKLQVCLRPENEDFHYLVEPLDSNVDQFDTNGYTSTCLILENKTSPEWSSVKRGACFYVGNKEESTQPQKYYWWRQARQFLLLEPKPAVPSELSMTFFSPIRLREVENTEHWADVEPVYELRSVKTRCNFKIRHGKLGELR